MEGNRKGTGISARLKVAAIFIIAASLVLSQGVIVANGTWQSMTEPTLISRAFDGTSANNESFEPSISDDGRYIVFSSYASNLTTDDGDSFGDDGTRDVFRHDRQTGTTELVSKATSPTEIVDRGSKEAKVSDTGRYVLFYTGYGFVPEDENDSQDLYVKDMDTGSFEWIDFYGDGSALDLCCYEFEISGDGSYVIIESDSSDLLETGKTDVRMNIWGYDLASHEATLVSSPVADDESSVAFRGSRTPSISDDGRYVAFLTGNDWDEDDTNDEQDLYVKDLQTGEMRYVDFLGDGEEVSDDVYNVEISGDGSRLVFQTDDDLFPEETNRREDIYAYDLESSEATLVSGPAVDDRGSRDPQISDDGNKVLFFTGQSFDANDVDDNQDFYIKDLTTGQFTRIPGTTDTMTSRQIGYICLSGDGQHIAFEGYGSGDIRFPSAAGVVPLDMGGVGNIYYIPVVPNKLSDGSTPIEGTTRYATAVEASVKAFPDGADTVVIATGEAWPDALGGSALAGAVDGPMLLTNPDSLSAAVQAELTRLGAKNVYLLGGYNAISPEVEAQLEMLLDGYVWRIGGPDRYATSKAVANRAIEVLGDEYDGKACVTTGMNFPDAVGTAPLGAGLGWPVLLVRPTDPTVVLPPTTDSAVIIGGTVAVGEAVETYLEGILGADSVDRVGGATRYDTSALAAQYGVDHGLVWNGVGITSGTNYPDALTGGVVCGLYRSTMLLTPPTSLHPAAENVLAANAADIDDVVFMGGSAAVSDAVRSKVASVLGL
ncbi:MAG: cell wall-binding repeat-containing protein [Actinomycetota bacterium]|jgi:putative cell wall-binding protein/Tol biopolymer transport system component|nr:cell wall-binding repeat-containing protein [Actinomycetota bacterium]